MTDPAQLRLVLASANPDKAAEIADILSAVSGLVLVPRPASVPEVVEDGDTLADNARLKAVAVMEATGEPAVADDTGLEVLALGALRVCTRRVSPARGHVRDNVASWSGSWRLPVRGIRPSGGPGSVRWPWWPFPVVTSSWPRVR